VGVARHARGVVDGAAMRTDRPVRPADELQTLASLGVIVESGIGQVDRRGGALL
jgi:hypothetical protein